jgi:hypothetical protein
LSIHKYSLTSRMAKSKKGRVFPPCPSILSD